MLARRLARQSDSIVAADGGANIARRYGIRPGIIIGDLDSITPATKRFFKTSTIIHVRRQDNTDLEKALDFIVTQKIKEALIIGATGKRLDFTLGNLSVIWKYTARLDIAFAGDGWIAIPIGRGRKMEAAPGTTVSLIPFGACSGVTLSGLRYPLTNATMGVGEVGVSNVVSKSPFWVRVNRGRMLAILLTGKRR
jgi:thiamine pyrophosphokinase